MATLYETFDREATRASNDWQRNFVLGYGSAYATAVDSFKSTIDEQKEVNKQDAEARERWFALATLALSLTGGSILLPIMANATAKALAAKAAFDAGTSARLNVTFKALAFVSTNKSAEFAVGKLWESGKEAISDNAKKKFAESPENYPSLQGLVDNPQVVQNHLDKYVRDIHDHILTTESDISSKSGNDESKVKSVTDLMQSPFFKAAPKRALDEARVAKDIELSFYCNMILNSDFLNSGVYIPMTVRGDHAHGGEYKQTSRTSIDVSVSDPKYPKRHFDSKTYSEVSYKQYGKVIMKRYADLSLSQAYFPIHHLNVNENQLINAGIALNFLSAMNLKQIQLVLKQ